MQDLLRVGEVFMEETSFVMRLGKSGRSWQGKRRHRIAHSGKHVADVDFLKRNRLTVA